MNGQRTTEQLDHVVAEVRQGLTFDPEFGIDEHPSLGNCYEFGMRTHRAMASRAPDSNHYVGFAHDHLFNTGALTHSGIYFLSSDLPGITASEDDTPDLRYLFDDNLCDAVRNGNISGILAGTVHLRLVEQAMPGERIDRAVKATERTWYTDIWLRSTPSVAVMEADYARDALINYNEFRRGIHYSEFEQIRASLEQLRVRTPQYETRPHYNTELRDFPRVVRYFARQAVAGKLGVSVRDLERLIRSYEEILPETNASANVVFGDCYRDAGKTFGSKRTVEEALKRYKTAGFYARMRRGGRNKLIESKLDKLKPLLQTGDPVKF
ncbi:MAG TPA: hypothetical protein VHB72_04220 [Candidatus Saccharimonadales bacterium]|nr:hypothetical protein [Candidatus Saccharimonadales bacterium]